MTIEELKAGIQDKDAAVRTQTWQDAAQLGAAGIARAKHFSIERSTQQYLDAYHAIAAARR